VHEREGRPEGVGECGRERDQWARKRGTGRRAQETSRCRGSENRKKPTGNQTSGCGFTDWERLRLQLLTSMAPFNRKMTGRNWLLPGVAGCGRVLEGAGGRGWVQGGCWRVWQGATAVGT
jgi:hypothetical protein